MTVAFRLKVPIGELFGTVNVFVNTLLLESTNDDVADRPMTLRSTRAFVTEKVLAGVAVAVYVNTCPR
jgi:hypothetical protein